jgi:hypothetical protein
MIILCKLCIRLLFHFCVVVPCSMNFLCFPSGYILFDKFLCVRHKKCWLIFRQCNKLGKKACLAIWKHDTQKCKAWKRNTFEIITNMCCRIAHDIKNTVNKYRLPPALAVFGSSPSGSLSSAFCLADALVRHCLPLIICNPQRAG